MAEPAYLETDKRRELLSSWNLSGRCIYCGKRFPGYHPLHRLCGCREGHVDRFHVDIVPFPRDPVPLDLLPDPDYPWFHRDFFAKRELVQGDSTPAGFLGSVPCSQLSPTMFPFFNHEPLASPFRLRLGNAVLWQDSFDRYARVTVLDFGSYIFSGTVKDPKSWAVVNLAITHGCRILAVYSEGNAAISLARIVKAANRFLKPCERITVVVIHRAGPGGLCRDIRQAIENEGAILISLSGMSHRLGSSLYIDEGLIWNQLRVQAGIDVAPNERWHVTDVYDGVGVWMYYLLFAQVLRRFRGSCRYSKLVVPVGTGSLFVGATLAVRDLYPDQDGPQVIAAVPDSGHYLSVAPKAGCRPPQVEKLLGGLSPVEPYIIEQKRSGRCVVARFSEADLLFAREQMQLPGRRGRSFEPSAIASLAVLPRLASGEVESADVDLHVRQVEAINTDEPILVVHTGSGIMSRRDRQWLEQPADLEHVANDVSATAREQISYL